MRRLIDGPKDYLHSRVGGPYEICNDTDLEAYNATYWLYEYALDAVETHDASLEDFEDADGILSSYMLIFRDEETGSIHEQGLQAADISPRGGNILNAAVSGKDAEELFELWRYDLFQEARAAG